MLSLFSEYLSIIYVGFFKLNKFKNRFSFFKLTLQYLVVFPDTEAAAIIFKNKASFDIVFNYMVMIKNLYIKDDVEKSKI